MMIEDNKHSKLRNNLKALPKLKARDDFENRLLSRLRDVDTQKYSYPSIRKLTHKGPRFSISGLLRPSLIPAIGVTVLLFICVIVYFQYFSSKITNPLSPITQQNESLQKHTEEQPPTKESDKLITKDEKLLNGNHNYMERSITEPIPTIPRSDFDKSVEPGTDEKSNESPDLRLSSPKLEDQKTDKSKIDDREIDLLKKDENKEEPVMKKGGDLKGIESKTKGENKELNEQNESGKDINVSIEQQRIIKDTTKIDSVKMKKHKKVKKDQNYIDSIKTPPEIKNQEEDSTKNK